MLSRVSVATLVLAGVTVPAAYFLHGHWQAQQAASYGKFIDHYCFNCHNRDDLTAGLSLQGLDLAKAGDSAEIWEKVVRKLRVGMMPPADAPRPPEPERQAVVSWLEARLDDAARPDPGPALVRRLNRAEYEHAIRDLLHLDVDATALLPPDDSAYGFDNNAEALGTSPVLVEQYLSAAGKVAALAVGDPSTGPAAQTFRVRQDASQNVPIAGMPIGTEGGAMWHVDLPLDGEYRLDVRYFKSNLGAMKGLETAHDVEIAVDGQRVHIATIGGPEDFAALMRNITEAAQAVEARSSATVPLTAGPHDISVGFVYQGAVETTRRLEPFLRSSQDILDVTGHPHIQTLTVTGPYHPSGSRRDAFPQAHLRLPSGVGWLVGLRTE